MDRSRRALAKKEETVSFDAATTQMRPALLEKAIGAGKHGYCEKPIATTLAEAMNICQIAEKSGSSRRRAGQVSCRA